MDTQNKWECMECGKKFKATEKQLRNMDIECPKCGSVDIEPA